MFGRNVAREEEHKTTSQKKTALLPDPYLGKQSRISRSGLGSPAQCSAVKQRALGEQVLGARNTDHLTVTSPVHFTWDSNPIREEGIENILAGKLREEVVQSLRNPSHLKGTHI